MTKFAWSTMHVCEWFGRVLGNCSVLLLVPESWFGLDSLHCPCCCWRFPWRPEWAPRWVTHVLSCVTLTSLCLSFLSKSRATSCVARSFLIRVLSCYIAHFVDSAPVARTDKKIWVAHQEVLNHPNSYLIRCLLIRMTLEGFDIAENVIPSRGWTRNQAVWSRSL